MLAHGQSSEALSTPIGTVYIGAQPQNAQAHKVLDFTPMPKGVRLTLEGFESDEIVKKRRGEPVFIDRTELPPPKEGEYYVEDLIGAEVRDADTETRLGSLSGVEGVAPSCPDRWWIQGESQSFAVPATAEYIVRVDAAARVIWVRDAQQFQ